MDKSGDKIAQAAIGRIRVSTIQHIADADVKLYCCHTLQAACREAGGTKPKVLINLSLNGIKVADLKTKVWLCTIRDSEGFN